MVSRFSLFIAAILFAAAASPQTPPSTPIVASVDVKVVNVDVSVTDGGGKTHGGYDYEETVRFQGRERTTRNARALANTARGLTEAAQSFSGLDGKKVIVLLSGGMEMNTSFAAYDTDRDRDTRDRKITM